MCGHEEVSHTTLDETHLALITALGSNVRIDPGTAHRSAVATNAFTVAPSFAHLQLEISTHVKLNSWLQVNTVPVPPPSVLESNEMAMKEPLLANTALRRTGASLSPAEG